jgi:6-phosphogluconolactonase
MRIISLPHAEVRILPDASALSRAAADEFHRAARASIGANGRFMVALAGGSTPKAIYSLLAADQKAGEHSLPWEKIHAFFGDERHVPPEHPDSNYRMASEALLSKVPIPAANIHRVRSELDAGRAAAEYEKELKSAFAPNTEAFPRFDLIMLGMGPDGHTASLFPGSAGLTEQRSFVCANWVEKFKSDRITLTFPLINAAAEVLFVVGGADKADMLRNVLRGDPSGQTYPAQHVQPTAGRLIWLIDQAGAARL